LVAGSGSLCSLSPGARVDGRIGTDVEEPTLVESLLRRVQAILAYADEMPSVTDDDEAEISGETEEVIFDEVEAAQGFLFGFLQSVESGGELDDYEWEPERRNVSPSTSDSSRQPLRDSATFF
jgi:hypothetical protein